MYNIAHLMKTYPQKSDMKNSNIYQWCKSPFKINAIRLLVIHKSNKIIRL